MQNTIFVLDFLGQFTGCSLEWRNESMNSSVVEFAPFHIPLRSAQLISISVIQKTPPGVRAYTEAETPTVEYTCTVTVQGIVDLDLR